VKGCAAMNIRDCYISATFEQNAEDSRVSMKRGKV
jgi:hypothetical protein